MSIKISVNKMLLDKQIKSSIAKKNNSAQLKRNIEAGNKLLIKEFEEMKKEMVKDFLSLPVTREISAGPTASNISRTLQGYGNLFTFIGFDFGSNPIAPIVQLLEKTKIEIFNPNPRGTIKVRIEMPSNKDIFAITPLPWATGISWAQSIEQGLSGLGWYMKKKSDSSRSTEGIQINNKIRNVKFSNTKYISHFLTKWNKKFLSIGKK